MFRTLSNIEDETYCENSYRLKDIKKLPQKAPSWMPGKILNTLPCIIKIMLKIRKQHLFPIYFIFIKLYRKYFLIPNNPSSANPTKWSNTVKQFVGCCRRIVLSVFDHFLGLALKELKVYEKHPNILSF